MNAVNVVSFVAYVVVLVHCDQTVPKQQHLVSGVIFCQLLKGVTVTNSLVTAIKRVKFHVCYKPNGLLSEIILKAAVLEVNKQCW